MIYVQLQFLIIVLNRSDVDQLNSLVVLLSLKCCYVSLRIDVDDAQVIEIATSFDDVRCPNHLVVDGVVVPS